MLAVLPRGVGWVTWDLQGEDPSLGSSLAEAAAAAGISLRGSWAGMSGTHPSPLALNRDNHGLAVIAWYCCCVPLMLVMVFEHQHDSPVCPLDGLSLPPHPSPAASLPAPTHGTIQPCQAAPCQEAVRDAQGGS